MMLLVPLLASCSWAETYDVELASYNYMSKPVFSYSVDGIPGGNALYGAIDAGSGWACCVRVTVGKPVEIRWFLRNERGHRDGTIRDEENQVSVIVPKPVGSGRPRFMEVHIYSQNHVELRLVAEPGTPRWLSVP